MDKKKEKNNENSGHVRVFIRFKPQNDQEQAQYNITPRSDQLHVPDAQGKIEQDKWYKFDRVFSKSALNREVYKTVGHSLVDGALNGFNGALFAYGQTGSGKTHTLMSKDGMTAHLISQLFNRIWNDTAYQYKVTCSYLQIYQEHIHDLLNANPKLDFNIREDPESGTFVENLSSYICHSPTDVYELLNIGRKRLVFGETRMNRLSSRSHAVCQLIIERKKKPKQTEEQDSPIEVSSPKHNQKPVIEIPELDFETIPFRQSNLKKRHSIAVSKPVRRNNSMNNVSSRKNRAYTPRRTKTGNLHPGTMNLNKRFSANFDRGAFNPDELPSRSHTPEPRLSMSASANNFRSLKRGNSNLDAEAASRLTIRRSSRPETPDLSRLDSLMLSNVSLADELANSTDSVIDDMYWQLEASTTDISKIFGEQNLTGEEAFAESTADDVTSDITSDDAKTESEEEVESVDGGILLNSKISIVDLAGSERLKKSQAEGERLHEAQHINLSLLELGNVISALADGHRSHVPYRNSLLTRLLQDSLGGNCKTSFVLCASTALGDIHETKCTLEFGQRLLKVTTQPKVNIEVDYKRLCEELKAKIEGMEEEHEKATQSMRKKLEVLEKENKSLVEKLDSQQTSTHNLQQEFNTKNTKNAELTVEIERLKKKDTLNENLIKKKENEITEAKNEIKLLLKETKKIAAAAAKKKDVKHIGTNTVLTTTRDTASNTCSLLTPEVTHSSTNTSPVHKPASCEVSLSPIPQPLLEDFFSNTSPVHKPVLSDTSSSPIPQPLLENSFSNTSPVPSENAYSNTSPVPETLMENSSCNTSPAPQTLLEDSSCNTSPAHQQLLTATIDASSNTSPIRSFIKKVSVHKGSNTSPVHVATHATSPIHQLKVNELERMRNVLLAELMSLQLLYSMFDLTINSQVEGNNKSTELENPINDNDRLENKKDHSPTPSGYETGSHSQLDIDRTSMVEKHESVPHSRNVTPDYFKFPNTENYLHDDNTMLTKLQESYVPKTGGLLEEIIEAQLSGCFSNSTAVSALPVEERIAFLRKEIGDHKKSIDDELVKVAEEILKEEDLEEEGGRVRKRGVYSKLVQKLSDPDSCAEYNIEQFEQILNLVLVDHSLTGCLLALSHKRKNKNTENMMRRLSSLKSTPKSLLDYIDIDQELYGYENEAAVFHDDDDVETMHDLDSVDNILDYSAPDSAEFPEVLKENDGIVDSEVSELGSDSECGSPSPQKKGLRRFFCMPVKSMKGSKSSKPVKKAKRSRKQEALLD